MKVNLNASVNEDKNMLHSFGKSGEHRGKEEDSSEHILSKDVRDLLKAYEKGNSLEEYKTSEYVSDSAYKASYKVEDPIVIFNEDVYHRVETKNLGKETRYESTSKY